MTAVGGLQARSLGVTFTDRDGRSFQALSEVGAQFGPGALTAIVGPSGSGKSTLLHALAGIVLPQQGEVACGDVVVNRLAERQRDAWRLANCGMVFQDFRLLDELDALGNAVLPAQFDRWRSNAALRTRAQDLLARFEVPLRSGPVARLSRGEQQRVALARALLLDPPLILADEPTASLDADNGQRIAQELRALAAAGKTVVAVTHDDKLVALADRVLTLRAGRLQ
ncbi:ATP-binding cassette domain-containing protein [Ramlibacter sp. XY19]|uniref:ABC transporter ATP-binding protein n=1 Tax=Ramlibacter paludis TaxID=2908000 RepID=UPI0023DBEE06|nr:ATP-binding cassette domain-containing protein [Ramlibacter paludis]MCG2592908.1 ATP-binding cassette domain-containing protein [Ramlibacter paludis]